MGKKTPPPPPSSPLMTSDNTFRGAQPPLSHLTRSLSTKEVTACVCVSADERVAFERVFMLTFEEQERLGGGAFQGTNIDAAGRQRTTYTRTQHHPEPPPLPCPPPPLCGMAIIKMIYLTIGPRLRD